MGFKHEVKTIMQLARPYKWVLINLFICVLVTSFVGMLYPFIFGKLVDEVFYQQNKQMFLHIIGVYVMIYVSEQSLHLILNATWAYLMTRFLFDIRRKIFEKVFSLKAKWFHHSQTGNLITLINKDAEEFMNLIHWNVFYVFANFLRLVTAVVLIALMNIKIALLMFIVVPLSVYTAMLFGKYIKLRLDLYRTEYGKTISWVFEILNGLRDIQLLAGERNVTRKFVGLWSKLIGLKVQKLQLELTSNRVIAFFSLCSDLSLYIISVYLIIEGSFTLGGFIATIEYFSRANGLLNNLSTANTRFQQNRVSIRRIFDLWNEQGEDKKGRPLNVREGEIRFNNVSFNYKPEANVLNGLSLVIKPNEKIALVGASGSGKSTLMLLLLRYYEPSEGEIFIDGEAIRDISIRSIRQNIGVVMQDPVIFDGTLRSNIQMAKRNASDEEILLALRHACLGPFIDALPEGLDTIIGSEGRSVSGGQRQRLAIARMFLKDPKILVLDEATSALDNEAEAIIQEAWDELCRYRTTIVISHRLSSISKADKIAFLHEGKIIAVGKHEELLEQCKEYARIFRHRVAVEGERHEKII
ncbi:ABC transporter ATP-binding protein [Paenibacillus macerans]|uniref:ABC transporter family protein n=1 Tax=Paenibacillus macerans TaxID=44252 RepID=A0A091A4J7_PAEMA|nr:ABC transporter ATP-binding protein [Paenibacillus macerans]KFN11216.1 ABC transporter family protein [Paenibacillus macerans]MCY7560227.1 ABC transporter ATP-binding protein/permease [Paenibacillus macerans]MEC0151281.1 ABC transporter ATP-binding protein [Paenibacillus macerans]SUD26816.1 ABC transporter ATP-binding protein/permease [Paenibacillus macerans]